MSLRVLEACRCHVWGTDQCALFRGPNAPRIPAIIQVEHQRGCEKTKTFQNRNLYCLDRMPLPSLHRHNWVAVKELNLSYYIGKPYYLQYIPIMVT